MRIVKIVITVLLIQLIVSCQKNSETRAIEGNWKITSAIGNDGRHWNGSFNLKLEGKVYKGIFLWDAVDGKSTGTDSIEGTYDIKKKVLTMRSVVISGNIESVVYTMDVFNKGRSMKGIWTGSSDGSVQNPGKWSAEKQ